jgi:hypothetical protein
MNWRINIIQYIKKYGNVIVEPILKTKRNLYLYYIRHKIYKAVDPSDLLSIFKTIASNNQFVTTDELLSLITEIFIKYPLTEIELQKISHWQQLYDSDLGLYCYVTTTLWLSSILAIQSTVYPLMNPRTITLI